MVSLIIFVLLFNLTYILALDDIPKEHIFHDSLEYEANDSKRKGNAQSSANKLSDQKNVDAPAPSLLKIPSNPFSGKDDVNVNNNKEVGNANDAQNQGKTNNEENHNGVASSNAKTDSKKEIVVSSVNSTNSTKQVNGSPLKQINNSASGENKNLEKNSTVNPIRLNPKEDIMQSGALLRGFYVFLGLSVITMLYFIFRSYRLRHASQPSTTVRKYGITARRSDMEMRHLELDDDDDDTLFEIANHNAIR